MYLRFYQPFSVRRHKIICIKTPVAFVKVYIYLKDTNYAAKFRLKINPKFANIIKILNDT